MLQRRLGNSNKGVSVVTVEIVGGIAAVNNRHNTALESPRRVGVSGYKSRQAMISTAYLVVAFYCLLLGTAKISRSQIPSLYGIKAVLRI